MATHKIPHTGDEIDTAIENALKITKKTVTITASDWATDSSTGFYRKTISDSAITAEMSVDLIFDVASLSTAQSCGIKAVTSSFTGGFYIYADSVPSASMTGTIITI